MDVRKFWGGEAMVGCYGFWVFFGRWSMAGKVGERGVVLSDRAAVVRWWGRGGERKIRSGRGWWKCEVLYMVKVVVWIVVLKKLLIVGFNLGEE